MNGFIGVAISTTGDDHRLNMLATCVNAWRMYLPLGSALVVTVDGDEHATYSSYAAMGPHKFGNVYRAGQGRPSREGHQGVAVNKNTGIELLMSQGVEHLFLCDDDTWPLSTGSLMNHVRLARDHDIPHNMVCWGAGRKPRQYTNYASWSWPRGVMMYAHHSVIEAVGGMDERFGPGGHEHVEWSQRIYASGLTPRPFCSPRVYADDRGMGVERFWHCSDIERKHQTTVRRKGSDWEKINRVMEQQAGNTDFVPYRAHSNAREYATLCSHLSGDRGVAAAKEPGRE